MTYKFRNENKRVPVKINSNLSLYDACQRCAGVRGGIVVESGRLVAFYCDWRKQVRAGFGANESERQAVENFAFGSFNPILR